MHFPVLEKEMATHSSVLAWRIPGTGEPGGLPSLGSHSRTQLKQLSSSSSSPRTLKCLLQHHSMKASILQHSAFFMDQLSQPYMTTGKTIALPIWIFVSKVMSLLFNMQSRFVMNFFPRNNHLLISWLQSPSVAGSQNGESRPWQRS